MSITASKDLAPGIEKCLFPDVQEESYVIENIEGDLPRFIQGRYYINGPAKFSRSNVQYRNWLDGDGMVCCLNFEGEQVRFTNRFVRGRKFTQEEEAHKAIYATFGTRFPGDQMRRGIATESPYNVSVYEFRDSLLAFGEQSIPIELDKDSLETIGDYDFGRQLNELSPFSAHVKVDPRNNELLNFGVSFAGRQPCVNYYRFDSDGKLACRKRAKIEHACSVHDFAVSENYVAIYLSPYVLDVSRMVEDGASTMDALAWRPELGSIVLVLRRSDGGEVARVPVGDRYCLHTINCFEQDDQLVLDVIELDRPVYDQYQVMPDLFLDAPFGRPCRLHLSLDSQQLVSRTEIAYVGTPDFPAIAPDDGTRPYNDLWMLGISTTGEPGRKFIDTVVHAKWDGGVSAFHSPAGSYFGGEPVFVENRGQFEESVVLCQQMESTGPSSSFVVFRAFDVEAGPVARLRLRTPVHFGFHASFYAR